MAKRDRPQLVGLPHQPNKPDPPLREAIENRL